MQGGFKFAGNTCSYAETDICKQKVELKLMNGIKIKTKVSYSPRRIIFLARKHAHRLALRSMPLDDLRNYLILE